MTDDKVWIVEKWTSKGVTRRIVGKDGKVLWEQYEAGKPPFVLFTQAALPWGVAPERPNE